MRAGTLPREAGGYFSLGKNINPQPSRGRVLRRTGVDYSTGEMPLAFAENWSLP